MPEQPIVVAIVNTNPDLLRLLRVRLEGAGFVVIVIHIEDIKIAAGDVEATVERHNPRVIVYDIAPPYDRSWAFLQHLRSTVLDGYRFVLTTTNTQHVESLVGLRDEKVYEVVGKADDLDTILRATREALRARDVR